MDKLQKLKALAAGKKKMSPVEQEAKMSVVEEMGQMATDAMKDKLHGLKKVTVAAKDKAGLAKGLEKAEEIVEGEDESPEGMMAHEALETPEEEMEEESALASEDEDEMTEDEINAKIEELMKLKSKKMKV